MHALHANIDFLLQLSDIRTCCSQMGIVEHCIEFLHRIPNLTFTKEGENMLCESGPFFSRDTLFEINKKESHLLNTRTM